MNFSRRPEVPETGTMDNTTFQFSITTESLSDVTDIVTDVTDIVTSSQMAAWCNACVSAFIESRISRVLWNYMSPAIVLLGTVGNLLTLAVLNSKHHKSSPINVALAFLAVADLAVLLLAVAHQWVRKVWGFDIRTIHSLGCKIHLTLSMFALTFSPNILALTTIERAMSVLWPLQIKSMITRKTMIWACTAMTSFVFACHVPLFVTVYLKPHVPSYRQCQWHDPTFTKFWYWFSFVIQYLGPLFVIFTGNALIITRLSVAAAKRSRATQTKVNRTNSTTVMLVLVGVAFVITMTPHYVYRLGTATGIWPNRPESAYARLQLNIAIGYQLMYLNSAINFLLYCLAGGRFRSSLKKMAFGDKKKPREVYVISGGGGTQESHVSSAGDVTDVGQSAE